MARLVPRPCSVSLDQTDQLHRAACLGVSRTSARSAPPPSSPRSGAFRKIYSRREAAPFITKISIRIHPTATWELQATKVCFETFEDILEVLYFNNF